VRKHLHLGEGRLSQVAAIDVDVPTPLSAATFIKAGEFQMIRFAAAAARAPLVSPAAAQKIDPKGIKTVPVTR
jgi:hypothetical protein